MEGSDIIFNIGIFLHVKDLLSLKLVQQSFNHTLSSSFFWQSKLKSDFGISTKLNNQSWLQRYQLALSMGNIVISDLCDSSPLNFDIGEEINVVDDPEINTFRILPYKAIQAIFVRPCLYYITDDHDLYMVGQPGYNAPIYKTPQLLDTNVTQLTGNPYTFLYLKQGNIHIHHDNNIIKLTDQGNIKQFSYSCPYLSYVEDDGICRRVELYWDEDNNVEIDYITHTHEDIINVIETASFTLLLNQSGRIQLDGILLDQEIKDYIEHNYITNIAGFIILINNQNRATCLSISQKDEDEEDDDLYKKIIIKLSNQFEHIPDVICGCESLLPSTSHSVLTKKGEVYVNKNDTVIKLNIKAKSMCQSPTNMLLII